MINLEISNDVIIDGCEKCLKNAMALKKDGTILFKRKRYNSAVVLLTVACEEIGKCNLLIYELLKFIEQKDVDWETFFKQHFKDHTLRLEEFLDIFYSTGDAAKVFKMYGLDKKECAKFLQYFKNSSLYTDFDFNTHYFYLSKENNFKDIKYGIKTLLFLLKIVLKQYRLELKKFELDYKDVIYVD